MSSASDGTLHCLYTAPGSPVGQRLRGQLQQGDSLLLLGRAVVLATSSHPELSQWLDCGATLYALEEDLQAYAVKELHVAVTRTHYAGWVALSERHRHQALWR